MKQILASKMLRKLLILSCLVSGLFFAVPGVVVQAARQQCITCDRYTVGMGGHLVNELIGPNFDFSDCVYNSYWISEPQPMPEFDPVTFCDDTE